MRTKSNHGEPIIPEKWEPELVCIGSSADAIARDAASYGVKPEHAIFEQDDIDEESWVVAYTIGRTY